MIFKNLTFDGISLKEYGVYISGEAVFDSPTRDVEMVTIPGRNGSFALDKGRFNNITVTYPAGIYATNETEFAEKVSTLRNLLASRKGYCRLTDEYNPDEFRLGVYKAGLELDPTHYNEAGRFELSFDCKPQRFLFSGEEVFTLGEWGETETYSGSIVSFEGDETTAVKSLTAQIVPKQSGSGDPSPSNVRPISGWSEVNVTRCGKNILKPSINSGLIGVNVGNDDTTVTASTRYGYTDPIDGSQPLTLSYRSTDLNKLDSVWVLRYRNGIVIERLLSATLTSNFAYKTFAGVEGTYIRVEYGSKSGYAVGDTPSGELQIELGTTATAYEPYNGTTYPISLGQTVYGGTLDVVSGKLTITHKSITLGSLTWTTGSDSIGQYFKVNYSPSDMAHPTSSGVNANAVCERYVISNSSNVFDGSLAIGWSAVPTGLVAIYCRDTTCQTLSAFQTAIANTKLVYELKTPTEITLTPTEVNTLVGQNNIWADSGDVTVEIGQNPNVLVNPTLFEACPLIEFNASGSGSINLGSKKMEFFNSPLGTISLPFTVSTSENTTDTTDTIEFSGSYNTGDKFRVKGSKATFNLTASSTIASVEFPGGMDLRVNPYESSKNGNNAVTTVEDWQETEFTIGTASTVNKTYTPTYGYGGSSHTATFTLSLVYDGDVTLRMVWTATLPSGMTLNRIATNSKYTLVCDSTANSLTGDLYIDLDIGEAYKVEDDSITSINNFVNLGGELPTLDPGATEVSTDATITNVKIKPRYWKV